MTASSSDPTVSSWQGGDGVWSDASSWSGGAIPGSTSKAVFASGHADTVSGSGSAGTLEIDDQVALDGTVTVAGGSLLGNGSLLVTGTLDAAADTTLVAGLSLLDQGMLRTDNALVSGALTVGGTLSNNGIWNDDGAVTVAGGGRVDLFRGTMDAASGVVVQAGATLALARHATLDGPITLQNGKLLSETTDGSSGADYTCVVSGDVLLSGTADMGTTDRVTLEIDGDVVGAGSDHLVVVHESAAAAGDVVLAGAVSVPGGMEVKSDARLTIEQHFTGTVSVDANATLSIDTALANPRNVHFSAPTSGALPEGGVLSGTLAVLAGSDLSESGFALGDGLDLADEDALAHRITTAYDTTTGKLTVLVDGVAQGVIALPKGLTSGGRVFAVATDGRQGSTIALVQGPTGQPATAVDAQGAWQEGATGSGVTIGIISDGFNSNGGLWQSIANGLLPASANSSYDPRWDKTGAPTDEGRAMAEIVHQVAPDANILFASQSADADPGTLPPGAVSRFDAGMAEAVDRLAGQGARVIVDDVTSPTEPFYNDSGTLLGQRIAYWESQGVVFVTSASNRGTNSYEDTIKVTATTDLTTDGTSLFAYRFNDGPGEAAFLQQITIANNGDGVKPVMLQWAGDASLSLRFYTMNGGRYEEVPAANSGTATQRVYSLAPGAYSVAVVSTSPDASGTFKFIMDDSNDTIAGNTHQGSGSISGHDLNPNEITVGAINYVDTPAAGGTLKSAAFSSGGPGAILENGTLVPLSKPDVSAAQRTPTSVTGISTATDPTGIAGLNNFGGTSAAAPVVAAAAAMLEQVDLKLTASDIRNLLKDSAWAMPDASVTAGSGLIRADLAVGYAQTHVISQFAGGNDILFGTAESERIVTSLGNTTVDGAGGSDTISAGGQSTSVIGGTGTLAIDVTSGALLLSQGAGSVTVHGGGAGSLVEGGTDGHNLLAGGGGGTLWGGGNGDTISGGAGDVIGSAAQGNATLIGSTGNVLVDTSGTLSFTGTSATVFGAQGSASGSASDVVVGTGDFTAVGRGGATTVFGGDGNSTVWVGNSAVTDVAGAGAATIVGGSGHADVWIGATAGAQDILALAGASGGGSTTVLGFRAGIDQLSTIGYAPGSMHASVQNGSLTVTLQDHSSITFVGVATLA